MSDPLPTGKDEASNVRRFVAFVGIFIILLSQFLVFSEPLVTGGLFPPFTWLAVLGVVILVASQLIRPTPFVQKLSETRFFSERVFWIQVSILLSVLTASATTFFMTHTRVNYIPVVTIWLLSAVCYLYSFRSTMNYSRSITDWLKANRVEILSVVVVMFFAAAVRLYQLGDIPRVLDGDEGSVGLFAQATSVAPLTNPFALWENFGALYLQFINLSLKFFGITPFGLRLMPAIGGILAIPAVYLLARRIGGQRIALIAAIILAFSHSHIHFSRIVSVAYIQGTWLAPLEVYFLLSGLQKRESWRTAVGGIILAMHFSVYLTSQVIAGIILVFMLIAILFYRKWFMPRVPQALAFWGGFLIMILPSAVYIFGNPEQFLNRLTQAGTFQSGYLDMVMASTGQSAVQVLFGRVVNAFLSLIYYPALDFYGSPAPMMSMISSVMFLTGMGLALWRLRDPAFLLLNGYFWGATVSIGVFATPPSADSYRMLMALPAAIIMASLGLDMVMELIGLGWKNMRTAYTFAVSSVLVSLLIFNLWTYYADFAGQCRFAENIVGRFASYLGRQVSEIESEQRIYLLSDNEFRHGTHASAYFLSRSRPVINFPDPVDTLTPISGETIIAPPSRIEELEAWADANPGGSLHYEYDCDTNILLMYRVP